ncbi:MAG: putative molybdenum carrier protein [Verrucomicrobiales bacterium]
MIDPDHDASPPRPRLTLVSGGQTGADRAALDFALAAGIRCGGWCPAGRAAEDGPIAARYPLAEGAGGYAERTALNVRDADATVIMGSGAALSGGTALTAQLAEEAGKPWLRLSREADGAGGAARRLAAFVETHRPARLNVAGPRASNDGGAYRFACAVLAGGLLGLRQVWERLSPSPSPGDDVFEDLCARHCEPPRRYHGPLHLAECFAQWAQNGADPDLGWALWFHDAIYDPQRGDNEAASAALAEAALAATLPQTAAIAALIRATDHRSTPDPALAEKAALLCEIDLAILGAEPERYREYAAQIRAEYAHVPEPAFREGRAQILRAFAARLPIFRRLKSAERLNARAAENLRWELECLGGEPR